MNEARRFMRYVMPGIVFAIQLTIVLWLLRPDWVNDYLSSLKDDTGIGLVFVGVLASGGFGVLFSAIHHSWHWHPRGKTLDHRNVLKQLVDKQVIAIKGGPPKALSRKEAWALLTRLWHERIKIEGKKIESAEPGCEELIDMVHSAGTMRVAVLAATVIAVFIAAINSEFKPYGWPLVRFIGATLFATLVCWSLQSNYIRLARFAQDLIEGVLFDALSEEAAEKKNPVEAWWVS